MSDSTSTLPPPPNDALDPRTLLQLLISAASADHAWPDREARIIALVADDELPLSEIAAQLGMSESAVKHTLRAAFGAGRLLAPGPYLG